MSGDPDEPGGREQPAHPDGRNATTKRESQPFHDILRDCLTAGVHQRPYNSARGRLVQRVLGSAIVNPESFRSEQQTRSESRKSTRGLRIGLFRIGYAAGPHEERGVND